MIDLGAMELLTIALLGGPVAAALAPAIGLAAVVGLVL